MHAPARAQRVVARMTLTRQVALLSLIPMVILGVLLARVLQAQILARTLADQSQAARLITRIGIQPALSERKVRQGLNPATVAALDRQLRSGTVKRDLARIKIWNANDTVVYSDDHSLIGRRLKPSDDLEHALAGRPNEAIIVNPTPNSETAGEVGLGTLIEVYVPLRFAASGPPAGAFEIYLSYRPVAGAIARDKRTIALLVAVGLALLWLVLYRIVARASRKLRQQASENYRLARFDQLTSLPNRTLFTERLQAHLRAARRPATTAVLAIDIDGFTQINHTLGNAIGDQVLRETARRLAAGLADDAVVARLGDDEFAVLCGTVDGEAGALGKAADAQRRLESPMAFDGIALNVEAAFGVATAAPGALAAEELLQHAEAGLARACAERTQVELYRPERDSFDANRLILLGQVRGALERGEFILHYQPKLDLATGRTTGVEALVRWRHPERGLLGPVDFVPLIEQTALVGPFTLSVVDNAARQLVAWRELGLDIEMSVNLSARNLLDDDLPAKIFDILRRRGVPAERLAVEVTESATMANSDKAALTLQALRSGGIGVSIDDYGTGNASIDYLARLPATELKIDRSFITGICEDPRAEAIVKSTIDLARHLDLKVVAEGIETDADLARVTALGCDMAQGYLISRPVPPEELVRHLTAGLDAAPGRSSGKASGAVPVATASRSV
jgi:diguanylate cyclase (GGDEF)-like protein